MKLKKILICFLCIFALSVPTYAFTFTDISKDENLEGLGTKANPVTTYSVPDLISKYMKIEGMNMGKMYYKTSNGESYDNVEVMNTSRELYPFLTLAWMNYEYNNKNEYSYYIDIDYYVPEYAEPVYAVVEDIVSRIITPDMSYYEKLQTIHDYLVDNVVYDWDLYRYNMSDTKNVGFTAYGALVNGKAVCEGYSSAFALMCHEAGIACYQISGTAAGGPHAWNIVYLYGSLYYVDATHDDGDGDTRDRYKYFMKTESEMRKTHGFDKESNWNAIWNTHNEHLPEAQLLKELELLSGTGNGFNLDRQPTRAEAAVMIAKLSGADVILQYEDYSHPFTDVPAWASDYIACLYNFGVISGVSETKFGSDKTVSINDYLTFSLRALGYDDSDGAFTWQDAINKATNIGLINESDYVTGAKINRGEMVDIGLQMILTKDTDGDYPIITLNELGIVDSQRVVDIYHYLELRGFELAYK